VLSRRQRDRRTQWFSLEALRPEFDADGRLVDGGRRWEELASPAMGGARRAEHTDDDSLERLDITTVLPASCCAG